LHLIISTINLNNLFLNLSLQSGFTIIYLLRLMTCITKLVLFNPVIYLILRNSINIWLKNGQESVFRTISSTLWIL